MTPDESYPSRSDKSTTNSCLEAALDYHGRGWNVIPIYYGTKRPALESWKEWQEQWQTEKEIVEWFSDGTYGVGIICGEISGGLTVLDFDNPELYQIWAAENPSLAGTLPTVRTGRGYHVYFRSNLSKSIKGDGFDLKATGYVVAPPSVHESGEHYKWTIPLPPVGEPLPFFDEEGLCLPHHRRADAQTRIEAQTPNDPQKNYKQSLPPAPPPLARPEREKIVEQIINETLPTGAGQRNKKIFWLARKLRGLYETAEEAMPAFERWYHLAKPIIGTKDYEKSRIDFETAWENVKLPADCGPLGQAVLAAKAHLAEGAGVRQTDFVSESVCLLLQICCELSRLRPDGVFFLSQRTAAKVIDTSTQSARNLLLRFCRNGFLEKVGTPKEKKTTKWKRNAQEFRWVWKE